MFRSWRSVQFGPTPSWYLTTGAAGAWGQLRLAMSSVRGCYSIGLRTLDGSTSISVLKRVRVISGCNCDHLFNSLGRALGLFPKKIMRPYRLRRGLPALIAWFKNSTRVFSAPGFPICIRPEWAPSARILTSLNMVSLAAQIPFRWWVSYRGFSTNICSTVQGPHRFFFFLLCPGNLTIFRDPLGSCEPGLW